MLTFSRSPSLGLTQRLLSCIATTMPDPNLFKPKTYEGPSFYYVAAHKTHLFPFYSHYYKRHILAAQGHKELIFDEHGKPYVDMIGGISTVNVGHCHPRINRIYREQAPKLFSLSSTMVNQYQGEYAYQLCKTLGQGFDSVFLFNSGSEANDFAFNMARAYTKHQPILSLRNGYHGTAGNAYTLTSMSTWNSPLERKVDVQRLSWPNLYRVPQRNFQELLKDAELQIDATTNGKVAGFWIEPVMGAGGINPVPPEYVQGMEKLVKKLGGLFIADEVQTGFGRIGKEMWGFKWSGVKPDMVITAKAIANGYPLAAVITRREIADSMHHSLYPPYAGGPLECRIAQYVLNIIEDEQLHLNSYEIGGYLIKYFTRIQQKSRFIGEVRGKGMMIGVYMVKDKETKDYGSAEMNFIIDYARYNGVLFGRGGAFGNIVRCLAPLCLTKQNAKKAIDVFEYAVHLLEKERK